MFIDIHIHLVILAVKKMKFAMLMKDHVVVLDNQNKGAVTKLNN